MNITQFTMEEVRCFAERQEFNIRPLTFLVGENSTGKTTALACFQVLANYLSEGEIDFNSKPYSMGIFRDIVRNSRKAERAFKLGFTFRWSGKTGPVEHTVEFVEKEESIEPTVRSVMLKFTDDEKFTDDGIVLSADYAGKGGTPFTYCDKEQNRYRIGVNPVILDSNSPYSLLNRFRHRGERGSEEEIALANYLQEKHGGLRYSWEWGGSPVFSMAPIRFQPQRTYDSMREFDDPEGSDIPIRLMRIKATNKEKWAALKARLIEFGKSSGLFHNIDVRNFGGSMGNPFQLKVKVGGPNSNIIDVGYGVSQILPILVNIFDQPVSRQRIYRRAGIPFFLLQQPEVHLHPRAQAELSSLLATAAGRRRGGQSFIVETHSDYMIDRARVEIRKGNIRPGDVSLIYLEPKGRVVKVHNISFDKMGNMEGVPPHYREFFMTEYRQLMGFED